MCSYTAQAKKGVRKFSRKCKEVDPLRSQPDTLKLIDPFRNDHQIELIKSRALVGKEIVRE